MNDINCFCGDLALDKEDAIDPALYMRLGCRCVLHYHCLVQYLHYKIDDRLTMSLRGICCPYGSSCKSYHTLQEVNNDESRIYYITVTDLDNIVDYCNLQHPTLKRYLAENEYEELSHEKVASLRQWIEEEQNVKVAPPVIDTDDNLYIMATTKACPSCKFPSTHCHRHHCHHISPAQAPKRAGCINCHVEYCYQCLATGPENLRIRGSASTCKCGSWNRFCDSIVTRDDVNAWVAVKHGVPYDKRCGCIFCTDCRYEDPCNMCDGTCAVCRGLLMPSPLTATKDQSKLLPEMLGCTTGEYDPDNLRVPAHRRRPAVAETNTERIQRRIREAVSWVNSELLCRLHDVLCSAYGCLVLACNSWNVLAFYAPFLASTFIKNAFFLGFGCVWVWGEVVQFRGSRAVGRATYSWSSRILRCMFLTTVCSAILKLTPWRNNHYFFTGSMLEDLWLLLLTIVTPAHVWELWFARLPLIIARHMWVMQAITWLLPAMMAPPASASILDIEDNRVLFALFSVYIFSSLTITSSRQMMAFRDRVLDWFNASGNRSTWFLLHAIEASVGLGVLFSMSWLSIAATIGLSLIVSLVFFGSEIVAILTPLFVGILRIAMELDHIRHYLYLQYLQQCLQEYPALSPWVIHALEIIACVAITYVIGILDNTTHVEARATVPLHLFGLKFLDLLRVAVTYATTRITQQFHLDLGEISLQKVWAESGGIITLLIFIYFCCCGRRHRRG